MVSKAPGSTSCNSTSELRDSSWKFTLNQNFSSSNPSRSEKAKPYSPLLLKCRSIFVFIHTFHGQGQGRGSTPGLGRITAGCRWMRICRKRGSVKPNSQVTLARTPFSESHPGGDLMDTTRQPQCVDRPQTPAGCPVHGILGASGLLWKNHLVFFTWARKEAAAE